MSGREMALTIRDVIKNALPEILGKLEVAAADLGVRPGFGGKERLSRELEHLSHPHYESGLFGELPVAAQARARTLPPLSGLAGACMMTHGSSGR